MAEVKASELDVDSDSEPELENEEIKWQIQELLFLNGEGLFEWLVMPFDLKISPANFMRIMDDILCPFTNTFVVVYLDDILI